MSDETAAPNTDPPATGYLRRLGVWDTSMIVVGGVIGAGIFLNPKLVAERTNTSAEVLAFWAIGALVGLIGALCYAELGARRPQAGGTYVYLREAFGPLVAFLFGWIMLLINYSGSIAMVAVTSATYACAALGVPADSGLIKPLAIGGIVLLTGINFTGIKSGATVQNVLTAFKLVAIVAVIVTGLFFAAPFLPATNTTPPATASLWNFGAIFMPVLFSYGGWAYANNIAGEIENPQRNIPRALIIGMSLVAACYLLANLAYLHVLGHNGLAASTAPAAAVMQSAFGDWGGRLIAIGIAISTFGFCNISIIGGARVFQVMGADGVFFRATGHLHPRFRTPDVALAALSGWAIVLALSGSYGQLLDYSTFADWLGYAGAVATLFYYRRLRNEPSVFRAPGFPILPGLFVVVTLATVVSNVIASPRDAGMALLITLAGVPVYWYWTRGQQRWKV